MTCHSTDMHGVSGQCGSGSVGLMSPSWRTEHNTLCIRRVARQYGSGCVSSESHWRGSFSHSTHTDMAAHQCGCEDEPEAWRSHKTSSHSICTHSFSSCAPGQHEHVNVPADCLFCRTISHKPDKGKWVWPHHRTLSASCGDPGGTCD